MPLNPQNLPQNAEKVFSGEIFDVYQWQQELYDGSFATFEKLARADYAYAIGVLPNKKILLVEDEQPDRGPVLAPAGGKVEDGEDAATGAIREFKEETGYTIGTLTPWHTYKPNNKLFLEIHAFIGRDLTDKAEPALEAGERITLQEYSFDEFLALGTNDLLRDWMLRIKLLEAQLEQTKREELHSLLYG